MVPICHETDYIQFKVKDLDFNQSVDLLGTTRLSVKELIQVGANGMPQRTGVHRVSFLDGKPRHGSLEYYVEYVPLKLLRAHGDFPVVPGTYFTPHEGNNVKLYINADDSSKLTPAVTFGEGGKVWTPQRLWRDTYDSMRAAKHFIYITGWAVDYTQSLLRGTERDEAIANNEYSPRIGDLLVKKASEGVTVNVMVWDDQTSNSFVDGVMGTNDEHLRQFFSKTKVNCFMCPMVGGKENPYLAKIRNSVVFTHHQKLVVCDDSVSGLVGYVGGVDLTSGRYDTPEYPLFRTLQSVHLNDFHNGCNMFSNIETIGPRQPWHDIHLCVRGPAVHDIIQNFEERWSRQNSQEIHKLVALTDKGIQAVALEGEKKGSWSTQFFRSIDARTARFDSKSVGRSKAPDFDQIRGVKFEKVFKKQPSTKTLRRKVWQAEPQLHQTFVSDDITGFDFNRSLHHKKGCDIDCGIQEALVHHIRRAKHCVYIESQYFLSSSHIWPQQKSTSCRNLVAAELTLKICEKIEKGERFAAYILIPMWPEGVPESGSVQAILHWQRLSMEGMYVAISDAIRLKKEACEQMGSQFEASPTDYLNFYCLGTRETNEGSEATGVPAAGSQGAVLSESRRHLVYVHSKMTIVDDEVALIGSANINQRSLDGTRDSEIVQAAWQPDFMSTESAIAKGDVHGFRLHCWAHNTGSMSDVFRDPSSLACVHYLNSIAKKNWEVYEQAGATNMDSYLLAYPISISIDGKLSAGTKSGFFPDTKASILGAESVIPNIVTT